MDDDDYRLAAWVESDDAMAVNVHVAAMVLHDLRRRFLAEPTEEEIAAAKDKFITGFMVIALVVSLWVGSR